jgi:alpha-amylase/alpha-mannosidase (GH57 family)
MARALERHPLVHVTVNFVPSLLEQLEAMLGGAKDALERLAERPADTLDDQEQRLVVDRSFSVHPDHAIAPRPRYAELLARRRAGLAFAPSDLNDVQCLFLLAWLGFAAREDEPAIDVLDRKGKGFGEDDKIVLLSAVRQAAAKVLPAWKHLCARGQVELSTSPYYHPILPLLIDSDAAGRARPDDELPPRFAYPDDAREQIQLAMDAHLRLFGVPAQGMWPPEGALSPEAVRLYGECGVTWLCSDEGVLARSLHGAQPEQAPARAHVWRYADTRLLFRDRELSDRVGFRYARMSAMDATDDLLASALEIDGIVGIFLDGENAWEAYPSRGATFLSTLYRALEAEQAVGRLCTRTVSEVIAAHEPRPLAELHSGSWIDAAFRIWIGDPEKNRAWSLLREARERLAQLARSRGETDPRVQSAKKLLLAAEGSDWFWWLGEPFSSAEDPIFDELFRAHLEAAWRALGESPPAHLGLPIGKSTSRPQVTPTTLVSPRIDGRQDRFYEWAGAARYDVGRGGAMADAAPVVERVFIGFDHDHLYLCLVPAGHQRRRLAAAHLTLRLSSGDSSRTLHIDAGAADGGPELRAIGGRVGAWDAVELALPFALLPALPRHEVHFHVSLEFAGLSLGRIPHAGAISVTVPWPGWEDENWSA